jgi:hypothetical protein
MTKWQQFLEVIKKYTFNTTTVDLQTNGAADIKTALSALGLPPKLVFKLSQTGTAVPTLTAILNTIGATVGTPTRTSAGFYTVPITGTGLLTTALASKIPIKIANGCTAGLVTAEVLATDVLTIKTYQVTDGAIADVMLDNCTFEIDFYPQS